MIILSLTIVTHTLHPQRHVQQSLARDRGDPDCARPSWPDSSDRGQFVLGTSTLSPRRLVFNSLVHAFQLETRAQQFTEYERHLSSEFKLAQASAQHIRAQHAKLRQKFDFILACSRQSGTADVDSEFDLDDGAVNMSDLPRIEADSRRLLLETDAKCRYTSRSATADASPTQQGAQGIDEGASSVDMLEDALRKGNVDELVHFDKKVKSSSRDSDQRRQRKSGLRQPRNHLISEIERLFDNDPTCISIT